MNFPVIPTGWKKKKKKTLTVYATSTSGLNLYTDTGSVITLHPLVHNIITLRCNNFPFMLFSPPVEISGTPNICKVEIHVSQCGHLFRTFSGAEGVLEWCRSLRFATGVHTPGSVWVERSDSEAFSAMLCGVPWLLEWSGPFPWGNTNVSSSQPYWVKEKQSNWINTL